MIKKIKKFNTMYFEDKTAVRFTMLPYGYFYKGKFYTVAGCFKALEKDGEIETHKYPNGTWKYQTRLYSSLEELYEWEQENIAMPYGQFRRHYKECGVSHNYCPCSLYLYTKDDNRELFDDKEQVISELEWYVNDIKFLAGTEDYEEWYLEDFTKEQCIAYFKKPIKERIKLLEEWL
jgi:hypothetical protein